MRVLFGNEMHTLDCEKMIAKDINLLGIKSWVELKFGSIEERLENEKWYLKSLNEKITLQNDSLLNNAISKNGNIHCFIHFTNNDNNNNNNNQQKTLLKGKY